MNAKRLVLTASVLSVLTLMAPAGRAGSGSSTEYEIGKGGSIEREVRRADGSITRVVLKGPQKCSNIQVAIDAAALAKLAALVPTGGAVSQMRTWADQDATQPLLVQGQPLNFTPSAAVTAEAQAFHPAPPGFQWQGYQSQPVFGTFQPGDLDFFISIDYDAYPTPEQIGPHMDAVYVSDNAETVISLFMPYPVYATAVPTASELGLALMATLIVGAGIYLIRRK